MFNPSPRLSRYILPSALIVFGALSFSTVEASPDSAAETSPACMDGATPEHTTFVSWGGTTQHAQNVAWAQSFTKKTGIKVVNAGPTNYGKLKAMVKSGNVSWDVVDVEGTFAYKAAKAGLLEPLNYKIIDRNDVQDRFRTPYAVGDFYYSFVIAYNKNRVQKPATGWGDVFNTSDYPGMRTFYGYPQPGVLEAALLASGVKPENLYPLDLERAFNQLDKIKKDIVWWKTGSQSQQLIATGAVSMGSFWNGRLYYLQKKELPVETVWKHNLATADFLVVPKGAPHKCAAMRFIAHAVSAKPQAKFAAMTAYAPVNPKAVKLLPEDIAPHLPTAHTETQVTLSIKYWAEHSEKINKAWHNWLLK